MIGLMLVSCCSDEETTTTTTVIVKTDPKPFDMIKYIKNSVNAGGWTNDIATVIAKDDNIFFFNKVRSNMSLKFYMSSVSHDYNTVSILVGKNKVTLTDAENLELSKFFVKYTNATIKKIDNKVRASIVNDEPETFVEPVVNDDNW
jgi:hypothetical protein|tara:strand:+ start:111 stop:548 length:438 start_codon:yes stop_codon:yes gene_type:complete